VFVLVREIKIRGSNVENCGERQNSFATDTIHRCCMAFALSFAIAGRVAEIKRKKKN